jgi:hypothetical protein
MISMKKGTCSWPLILSRILAISSELGMNTCKVYQQAIAKGQWKSI